MLQCIYYGTKIVNNNENVFSKNIIKLISDEKISIKTIMPLSTITERLEDSHPICPC